MRTKSSYRIVLSMIVCSCLNACLATSTGTATASIDSAVMSLKDMLDGTSSSTTSDSSSSGTSGQQCQSGQPPAPPDIGACETDAAAYCSQYAFPTAPTSTAQGTPLDPRLAQCLKTNLGELSSACVDQVDALPANPSPRPPQQGGPGQGPGRSEAQNGGAPQNSCGNLQAYTFLGPCDADASTYCSSDLPTQSAFRAMTLEEQLQALLTVVDCLRTNESSVAAACQTALGSASSSSSSSSQ